ncbi:hypothetical protein CYY_010017, partial [Polysphondylium violaceum]
MFNKLLSVLICLLFISTIQSASIVDIIAPEDVYGSSYGCTDRLYQVIVNSATPVNVASVNGVIRVVNSLVNGTISVHDVSITFPNVGRNDQSLTLIDDAGNSQVFPNVITYYCTTVPTYTLATEGGWAQSMATPVYSWYKFISLNGLSKPTEYSSLGCSVSAPFICQVIQYPAILTSYYYIIYLYMTNENVPYSFPANVEISNSYGTNKLIFPFNEIPAGPNTISNIEVYPANNSVVSTAVMSEAHFFFDTSNIKVLPSISAGYPYKYDMNVPVYGTPANAKYFGLIPVQGSSAPTNFYLESIAKTGSTRLSPNHQIQYQTPARSNEVPTDATTSSSDVTELGPGFKLFSLKSKTHTYFGFSYSESGNGSKPFETTYPYGITNGNVKEFYHACTKFVDNYSPSSQAYCAGLSFNNLQNPLATVDDISPSVTNVEVFGLDAEKVLIRVYANDDISGIQKLEFLEGTSNAVTNRDLVKGTKMNGVYEIVAKFISYTYNSPRFTAYDTKTNMLKLKSSKAILNTLTRERVPRYPIYDFIQSTNLQTLEFTFIQFKYNDVDLSTTGINNSLYFNITNAHPSMVPRVRFFATKLDLFDPSINYQESFIEGFWNATIKLYQVDFYLPPRIFTGTVPFNIFMAPNAWESAMLVSAYGAQSQLRVISSNGDLMPPVVSAYAAYPSTAVNVVVNTEIGWTITIQDPINGLKSATFNITSDYDWEPYTIKVTPANVVSGDKYTGVYNIRIPVSVNCRSQIFKISSMVMTDTSDHSSFYPSNGQVNSLYKFINSDQHNININC